MEHIELLKKLDACSEALDFIQASGSLEAAWSQCNREGWMLWLLRKIGFSQRLYACACVRRMPLRDGRTVWDLLTDDRSRNAVVVAENYANGLATEEELNAAVAAAWDVYSWGASGLAARDAARAASGDASLWDTQCNILREIVPFLVVQECIDKLCLNEGVLAPTVEPQTTEASS